MADVLTPEQRKKNMRNIRSKDTEIERILRHALWEKGYRYRKNYDKLPGHPDIVLTKYKIAIFCDGEFFHGKDWDELRPKLQRGEHGAFWVEKITKNMERDDRIDKELRYRGWKAIHFWGIEIKHDVDACIRVIEEEVFESRMENFFSQSFDDEWEK